VISVQDQKKLLTVCYYLRPIIGQASIASYGLGKSNDITAKLQMQSLIGWALSFSKTFRPRDSEQNFQHTLLNPQGSDIDDCQQKARLDVQSRRRRWRTPKQGDIRAYSAMIHSRNDSKSIRKQLLLAGDYSATGEVRFATKLGMFFKDWLA